MINGITKSGFAFAIEESALDDWELIEALQEIDDGKTSLLVRVPKILLGEKQTKKLKEHLRENGRVSAKAMTQAISEIFEACNELKNL